MKYGINTYPDTTTKGAFCWVAEHPGLPGCAAHAGTLGEALERLAEAREAYLANLEVVDATIPDVLPYSWHVDPLEAHKDPSPFSFC